MSRQIVEDSRCLLLWHEAYSLVWFLCPAASVLRFLPVKVKGTKIRLNKSKLCGPYPCHVTLLYENEANLVPRNFHLPALRERQRRRNGGKLMDPGNEDEVQTVRLLLLILFTLQVGQSLLDTWGSNVNSCGRSTCWPWKFYLPKERRKE